MALRFVFDFGLRGSQKTDLKESETIVLFSIHCKLDVKKLCRKEVNRAYLIERVLRHWIMEHQKLPTNIIITLISQTKP